MLHRFRALVLLLAATLVAVGVYLIYDSLASSVRSDDLLVISGACCCAIALILIVQLFRHGRDPREPIEE
jgi:predicted tellurium resistance membrane protein TerC